MNERIKELARQSQMVFWPTDPEVVELSKDIDIAVSYTHLTLPTNREV